MKLMTKSILNQFLKQGDTSEMKPSDIQVYLKLFNPAGAQTWYIYDIDSMYHNQESVKPDDIDIVWGFVNLGNSDFAELGTVSMKELQNLKLPLGLSIERDIGFDSISLEELQSRVRKGIHV